MNETRRRLDELELRAWQAQALADWSATGQGIVEAVTGSGKTRLALAALRLIVDRGGRGLVLVPTLDLQDQWVWQLREALPDRRIGRLGGGHDDDLHDRDVVVATPQSAASIPVDLPPGVPGILVADEAHRYGAPTWASALSEIFVFRLALTATYERSDDGLDRILSPYFGEVVHRHDFVAASQQGTIAPFSVALVGIDLDEEERGRYDEADRRVRRLHRELVGGLGMPQEPRALLRAVAAVVASAGQGPSPGRQADACREYLVRVRQRREVAAQCTGKIGACRAVAPVLRGRRTLVFADTIDQGDLALSALSEHGLRVAALNGGLRAEERRQRLSAFRRGQFQVLVAPRVLDEGVDVPDADVGVVLAAFRTRRALVQRLGRLLRVKADGRQARLAIFYAKGTTEDPKLGGHEGFLDQVRPAAREVRDVSDLRALGGWLRSG